MAIRAISFSELFYHLGSTYAENHSSAVQWAVETVQDFLNKLDIKPLRHLLKISIFSLNNVILRLNKIMNRADKNWALFK